MHSHEIYCSRVLISLLVAVSSTSVTCRVISVDDGLVRLSTSVTVPAFSPTSYVVTLKNTQMTKRIKYFNMQSSVWIRLTVDLAENQAI